MKKMKKEIWMMKKYSLVKKKSWKPIKKMIRIQKLFSPKKIKNLLHPKMNRWVHYNSHQTEINKKVLFRKMMLMNLNKNFSNSCLNIKIDNIILTKF